MLLAPCPLYLQFSNPKHLLINNFGRLIIVSPIVFIKFNTYILILFKLNYSILIYLSN
ncbi:hypothetical protein GCM10008904_05020 [Paraclostridium ghonii]